MDAVTALLTGVAERLAASGLVRWNPDGVYAEQGLPAVVMSTVPQSPASVVTLSGYSVDDDPIDADTTTGIQVRCRGANADPRPVNDLAGAIFDALHGLHDTTVGGVEVQQMWRQSWAPLGEDQNRRHQRSDNYYAQHWQPGTHRL